MQGSDLDHLLWVHKMLLFIKLGAMPSAYLKSLDCEFKEIDGVHIQIFTLNQ